MIVKLHTQRLQTLAEVRAFLEGSTPLDFDVPARQDAYRWIESSLRQLRYRRLGRADKGLVKAYCSGQLIPDTKLSFSSATAGGIPPLN
jgi:hypothetical protein